MTSATERLRALLDERGVKWGDDGYPTTCTVWASDGIVWHGLWRDDCIELIAHLTPEQAVEATLGRGTCHKVKREDATDMFDHWVYGCSECGAQLDGIYGRYCPNCGAKVVRE